MAADV